MKRGTAVAHTGARAARDPVDAASAPSRVRIRRHGGLPRGAKLPGRDHVEPVRVSPSRRTAVPGSPPRGCTRAPCLRPDTSLPPRASTASLRTSEPLSQATDRAFYEHGGDAMLLEVARCRADSDSEEAPAVRQRSWRTWRATLSAARVTPSKILLPKKCPPSPATAGARAAFRDDSARKPSEPSARERSPETPETDIFCSPRAASAPPPPRREPRRAVDAGEARGHVPAPARDPAVPPPGAERVPAAPASRASPSPARSPRPPPPRARARATPAARTRRLSSRSPARPRRPAPPAFPASLTRRRSPKRFRAEAARRVAAHAVRADGSFPRGDCFEQPRGARRAQAEKPVRRDRRARVRGAREDAAVRGARSGPEGARRGLDRSRASFEEAL